MSCDDRDKTVNLLERFMRAWNAHDTEGLMACMTDDCIFYTSSGTTAVGTVCTGLDEVRSAYQQIFNRFPNATWLSPVHYVCESLEADSHSQRAMTTWRFQGNPAGGGAVVEAHGIDLLTIRNGRIAVKDTYRKQRT